MWQGGCDFLMEAVNGQVFQMEPINLIALNLFNLAPSIYQSFEIIYKKSGCINTARKD